MANKQHCDICDRVIVTRETVHGVTIDGPNHMLHKLRLAVNFSEFYGNGDRQDLCVVCQWKAFTAAAKLLEGRTVS